MLLAGPNRRSRMQMTFSEEVPDHLVAAVTTAVASPEPLVRERRMLSNVEQHVTLTPVQPTEPDRQEPSPLPRRSGPTPLDARINAVGAALQRARSAGVFTTRAPRRAAAAPATPPPLGAPAAPSNGRRR